MSYTQTQDYLVGAVKEDVGDTIAELIPAGFVERALNEGQRRLEPDFLLPSTLAVTLPAGSVTYTLPDDLVEIISFVSAEGGQPISEYFRHGQTIFFTCTTRSDFDGTLYYKAHYPAITEDSDCRLPAPAIDAIISFALYRCYRRFVGNRAEYRKFATIVGNGVTMADLEATAEAYLNEFLDAAESARQLPEPRSSYEA